ncbi:hypothetical protein HRW18_32850 [Streptomyces lunaelactis]|uniref:hypothetical protein n=1 Tax=Streptomyces lunaelactis TaxID=1535768 RepID=UPI0015853247|nr:hypothetical protein [Streptomyces lunaelactis]NUK12678.1 hypothetical protein [Streptomyces lunaelactis]
MTIQLPNGREITGALTVDCGEGREDAERGGIRYTRQPRAKYECFACHTTETASGPIDVKAFAAGIRDAHKTNCHPIHPARRKAQAA